MLRSAGFEIVDHPESEVFLCRRGATPPLGAAYPARGGPTNGHDSQGGRA
jgi:tRNA (mo5U34)-methyltransferase